MKKIISLLILIFFIVNFPTAQTTYSIGVKALFERNWLTDKGFDKLNEVLSANNIATLKNAHFTGGYGFTIGKKDKKLSFEFAFGGFTAKELNRPINDIDIVKPSITGQYNKMLIIAKLYELNRWRVRAGGGFSSNSLDFTLSDLRPQINTLSNLVSTPSISPSLTYEANLMTRLDILVESDYRTKLVNEAKGELSIGLRVGYGYQISRNINNIYWYAKETQNEIKNFPLVIMDNLAIQLNVNLVFNLISPEKSKKEK